MYGAAMAQEAEVSEMPRVGVVPPRMRAMVIRPERYGDPRSAFVEELIDTPLPRAGEALVYVMAAGVNYNNVWAALGRPVDVVAARMKAGEAEPFHIGGSDASGIVWAVGDGIWHWDGRSWSEDAWSHDNNVIGFSGVWGSAPSGSMRWA